MDPTETLSLLDNVLTGPYFQLLAYSVNTMCLHRTSQQCAPMLVWSAVAPCIALTPVDQAQHLPKFHLVGVVGERGGGIARTEVG